MITTLQQSYTLLLFLLLFSKNHRLQQSHQHRKVSYNNNKLFKHCYLYYYCSLVLLLVNVVDAYNIQQQIKPNNYHTFLHTLRRRSHSIHTHRTLYNTMSNNMEPIETTTTTSTSKTSETTLSSSSPSSTMERSTILLLEHINLNIPNHYDNAIPLYINILGLQYDIRRFHNVINQSGTIWVNCGASQFHLPYGIVSQHIPGKIGLRYNTYQWNGLQQRIQQHVLQQQQQKEEENESSTSSSTNCIQALNTGFDRYNRPYIEITDLYNNTFFCRCDDHNPNDTNNNNNQINNSLIHCVQQPIVTIQDETLIELYGKDVIEKYINNNSIQQQQHDKDESTTTTTTTATTTTTGCAGIDFIEFYCPIGTAEKIALFYDSCFDAPVRVIEQDDNDNDTTTSSNNNSKKDQTKKKIAIIAIGTINVETGQADQSLLFREVDTPIPDYDGYHIAMYIGETIADYEQAYKNCDLIDIIWINPRFNDKADTLDKAVNVYHQFRIHNIVDMETGDIIMELEHEIRSIQHEAWLGTSS